MPSAPFGFLPSAEEEARRGRVESWLGCGFWLVVVAGIAGVAYLSRYRVAHPALFYGPLVALATFLLVVQIVAALRRRL